MTDDATRQQVEALITAAENADWMQVVLNQGPPCFHYESKRQRYCLRAARWGGHGTDTLRHDHPFVSLADLLRVDATGQQVEAITMLTADDLEEIAQGIEEFIISDDAEMKAIWQPCVDKVRAVKANLPRETTDERWQPIETAPMGRDVELSNGERVIIGDWAHYCRLNAPKWTLWRDVAPPSATPETRRTK